MHQTPETTIEIQGPHVAQPATVFNIPEEERLTAPWLDREISRFTKNDDVWSNAFLATVVFTYSSERHVVDLERDRLKPRGEGPYFLHMGRLYPAYRLYPDTIGAFVVGTVPAEESYHYKAVDASAYGEQYPTALAVPVPSRLHFPKTPERPNAGTRIAVKDIIDLAGLKTGASSRAYVQLYEQRKSNAAIIQRLLELGFVVVGKVKTTQFADSEWPTCDWVDYHAPFNPRADGYQTTSGSSAGSAASVAAYGWLDYALGTDRAFARDASSFATIARALYATQDQPKCTKRPSKILYPSDYWPVQHEESQAVFDAYIRKLELFLGIQRTPIDLEQIWQKTNPLDINQKLKDFVEHVFEWVANPDQWNGFFQGFLSEYENTYHHRPVLNPQLQFKRDYLPTTLMPDRQEAALEAWRIFRDWYEKHIIPPADDSCLDTLLVLPWSQGEPDYRDRYRDSAQKFTGVGFFFYNISPYAQSPELIVPAGHTAYKSRITDREERLPAAIGIIGGRGSDVSLAEFVADFATASGVELLLKNDTRAHLLQKGLTYGTESMYDVLQKAMIGN
ncbi:hypothetical protein N0V90_001136 [Kalmusia sp. IMI 367209]|nr:hypothetical protein N0V90_001136 [Kalmusia sp. IMI 367209]